MIDGRWVQICWVHWTSLWVMSPWGQVMTVQNNGSSPTVWPLGWMKRGESKWIRCISLKWKADTILGLSSHPWLHKIGALLWYWTFNTSSNTDSAKRPQSWTKLQYIQILSKELMPGASLSMQLNRQIMTLEVSGPVTLSLMLVGGRPALHNRLAFHPQCPLSVPKVCLCVKPLAATDQCSRHGGFWVTQYTVTLQRSIHTVSAWVTVRLQKKIKKIKCSNVAVF